MLAVTLGAPFSGLQSSVVGTAHADAEASTVRPAGTLALGATLTDWVYDGAADAIYAISSNANKLYVINGQTLAIEKELLVGSQPSDIEQYGDQLFIALSGASFIQTVDTTSRSLGAQLATTVKPLRLAATRDYIFYINGDSYGFQNQVFKLERSTGISSSLPVSYMSGPVLRADENRHLLYVGETGSSGSDLIAFDYEANRKVSDSTYDGNYGFGFPYPMILTDGKDVFFGGSRLDGADLAVIYGAYPREGSYNYLISSIMDMNGAYVATSQGLYDKERYLRVASYPYEADKALIGKNGRVYLQASFPSGGPIEAYDLNLASPLPTVTFSPAADGQIVSSHKVDSWVTEDASPYLYGVSSETNELIAISKTDLSIASKRYIGSKPEHIALRNGKLYIAFGGETFIGVVEAASLDAGVQRIKTASNPHKVFPSSGRILYWGEDTFYYLHATDGVTDRRVFEQGNHALNPDYGAIFYNAPDNTLYTSASGAIYKVNPETLAFTQATPFNYGSSGGNLFVDGDDLYFNRQRMDIKALGSVLGTYPEQVLYARGGLVFGQKAVYNRDTYVKAAEYPAEVMDAYVSAEGEIFILSGMQLQKYDGIDAIRKAFTEKFTPKEVTLTDMGEIAGQVEGYLSFAPVQQIGNYAFYFLNAQSERVGQLQASWDRMLENGHYAYKFSATPIPAGAKYIGVVSLSSEGVELGVGKGLIWDVPAYFADTLKFSDVNTDARYVQGTVSWTIPNADAQAVYSLYWLGEDGPTEKIASFDGGETKYSFDLPKTEIAGAAFGLALVHERDQSEAPVYQYLIFDDFITPELASSDIVIVKNQYLADKVTVSRVSQGDRINVYNQNGLIGTGIVNTGASSLTIEIQNLGNPGAKLLVTRTMPGRFENEGTLITIPAVNGGGSTGGGAIPGPGPIIPAPGGGGGGGGGGGVTPTVPAPSVPGGSGAGNSANPAGANVDIKADDIKAGMEKEAFKQSGTLLLKSESSESSVNFRLQAADLRNALNGNNQAKLELSAPSGSWTIDAQSLTEALGKVKDAKDVSITIKAANESDTSGVKSALPANGQLIGSAMTFEITVSNGTDSEVVDRFSRYINHTLTISAGDVPLDELAGFMFDPATRTLLPVPATFERRDGQIIASLHRKGNSTYAVVRNKKTFKDVPSDSAFAAGIQALANRAVINGLPDGTFKPENNVTRSEFATMLVKALGIQTDADNPGKFKDVAANGWYTPYVLAASAAGIIDGDMEGKFRPNQTITHQEMVAMLVKAMRYASYSANAPTSGDDAAAGIPNLSNWAKSYYVEASQAKLIGQANDPFQFRANAAATRKECALLIYRVTNEVLF
ncbi:S-layer homology domain-containing protein [Paenibacillus aurantiacus]|uniref:S-layer homology domain-containing protein n=1 Tax=Paenibacillus aurantiacus TaxID=1936118 RepID=A0ABV5L1R1_9BACL